MNSLMSRFTLLTLFFITAITLGACSGNQESDIGSRASLPGGADDVDATDLPDAPDFTLENLDGSDFTLSDHKGKVILLNIWATWCPPCREEIPDFMEIQTEMEDDGVLFVGVATDREGWEVVRPFAEEFEINYPIMVDTGVVSRKYGPVQGIPMSFIINREGKVEYLLPGMVTKEMLQPLLEEVAQREV
ncbi:MAG: TlpA family protein disulfide reductase [Balneolaceae bacterium]|nr:TlpA family protein disulfide reductase [Balneolaceae bacterium]MCH8548477.1 TlpA family protein disulfide reductase [Balneolaceae bacterium]